ncbi:MAG: erythromycin esterase family protein [Acidobacteria bacterium]|nr:erythromycin esterase family protein [Acidobacteriota bacterium]
MKHRILEFLVEEMGFTVFAIEANLPEADVVDEYVQWGEGSAATALSGMYFWTWDTDEVLDLIEWMREYNLRRGDRPAVHFRGFDAQYVNVAVPRVRDFVARVDATRAGEVRELYRCIDGKNYVTYPSLSLAQQKACRESIGRAHALLEQNRSQYTAASSLEEYERHLRYARIVVQAEAIWTGGARARDAFMAENTIWLTDTVHAGKKVVLWAHNYHVAAHQPVAMGYPLRQHYGSAMVVVGFAFDRGTFNARSWPQGPPGPQTIASSPPGAYEEFFATAGQPRFLLDLRRLPPVAAQFLAQSRSIWSIGSVYEELSPTRYYRWALPLGAAFDLIVYFETTTASRLR